MKRYLHKDLPDTDVWATNTDDAMVNSFREAMAYNNQFVDDANVGIFWYDTEADDLFGVYMVDVEDVNYYHSDMFNSNTKTCRQLHYAMWQKGVNKGKDVRYNQKYTSVPRGRVFFVENQGFVVCVGHWINDYPSAKQLILDEFQLPDSTEFLIDSHWDIGRGWSDKNL